MEEINENTWINEAISFWNKAGIKIQEGSSLQKIREVERVLDFVFPKEFVDFYQKVNGFKDFECNEHMFSLWSLERMLEENKEHGTENFVLFCDYLINSHAIGFNRKDNRIYTEYNEFQLLASSFDEFILRLNSNDDLLY